MTQDSDERKNSPSTTTPPTTPTVIPTKTCDCEKGEVTLLEDEAMSAVRELSYAVSSICISEILPRTGQLMFINVTTLEGATYCVELTQKGWRVASNRQDCMNGDFRQLTIHTRYYDTLYALLDEISPKYREKFSQQLISKLEKLAENRKNDA